jgi:hypothetical protein
MLSGDEMSASKIFDDLLDLNMPESLVDQELTAIGVAPEDLARRAVQFVAQAKEEAKDAKSQIECIESADHWDRLSQSYKCRAAWNREQGLDLSAPGLSAGDHMAAACQKVARTLRLEAETGEAHCMCHERRLRLCPNGGMGIRF